MDEKILIVVAFIGSLAGILILFALSETIEYSEKTIEKINAERIEDMIKLNGEVTKVNNIGNITFISVRQPSYIDVIVFDNISLFPGENVEIIGKSEEYNNKMEIIAHRIRVIG